MIPKTIIDFVIIVIVLVWCATVLAEMIHPAYQIPNTVQVAMAAVAAFLFGNKILKEGK